MKYRKKLLITAALAAAFAAFTALFALYAEYGFAREVEAKERQLRQHVVATAQSWMGTQEGDSNHEKIVQTYNAHEPLAQGYEVTTTDNWCATFASVVAIETGLTGIIPTECGCQRQIGLWEELGRWEEDDNYLPLPGDYIYYAWDEGWDFGDCTAWADHVGIVAGTAGPFIRVIEGNYADKVVSRTILRGDMQIRGYGIPDYAGAAK